MLGGTMMLEDFFSQTKMKDWFMSPSCVEELVSVIQKEKDCAVKNIDEATRQWVAVANSIAATEDRDCLDRFIQLDGLGFINRWLNDAKKFGNETNESSVEESIAAMLEALEKLHVDNELSISSGIWITVKSLLDHGSSRIQDRAKALFDSWKQVRASDTVDSDVESSGPCHNDGIAVSSVHAEEGNKSECSELDVPHPKASLKEEDNGAEHTGAEILPSNSGLHLEKVEDVQTQTHNNKQHSHLNLDHSDMEDKPPDHLASIVSNSALENSLMRENSTISTAEATSSIETCSSPVAKQSRDEGQSDALKMNEFSKDEKKVHKVSSFPEKLTTTASASTSNMVEPRTVFSAADDASAYQTLTEPAPEKNHDTNEGDLLIKATPLGDEKTHASEKDSERNDMAVTNNCSTHLSKTTGGDDESHSDTIPELSGDECTYGNCKDSETSFSRIRGIGLINEDKDDNSSNLRNNSDFSKMGVDHCSAGVNNRRTFDIELEYDMVDALEVARQVAQEVGREVVDYREPSCSSSDKISDGGIRLPASPDSINGKQDLANDEPPNELPTGQNNSAKTYHEGEGLVINLDNVETEPENGIADMESSQVTEAAQEPEVKPEKGYCDFDLNQEVFSDDMDRLVNPVSTPISVVSASRPAAAPGLPAAPLQFEGALGWKGCAATSAFRPASPRRVSDYDKTTLTVGGISSSAKHRPDCLDIDLNVAESGDDKLADLMPEKQIPVSSGLHSAESSLEVSPRRSERLKLDLNRVSDDSDAPAADFRPEGWLLYNHNGHRSPSPASSSSSIQPSLRNIDLNDRPHLHTDISDSGPSHGKSPQNVIAFGVSKPDDPVISIMGARVEVNRKDFIPQVSSLPNGKTVDTAMDANMSRTGGVLGLGPPVSYSHSPVFGYNGFTAGPSLSYSSPMYGGVHYMVDSRGAPVVPQIVGSAAAVPQTYSQPPFIMSMTSAPSGLNGAGSSRQNFDLNSGFPIDGGNRDSLGLRQLFIPGQGRSMEEHLRASSQPSSSGVGGKRKEPDSGREPYPFNYRHQQPPWK